MNSIEPMKNGRTMAKKMARMRDGVLGLVRLEDGGHVAGGSEGRGGRGRSWSEQLELEELELEECPLVGISRVMLQSDALCSQCCKVMLLSVQMEEPAYETPSPSRNSTPGNRRLPMWQRGVSFCMSLSTAPQ
jgi:hypothetical protein